MGIFSLSQDLGIDLGTANTLVYVKGKGVVVREPSVVARNTATGQIEAVGTEAKNMLGRTAGNITVIRPMKDGVIADYETTAIMMNYYIKEAQKKRSSFAKKPNVVICVPTGITMVEERAVIDATKQAGAKEAYPIAEAFAAALGAGLPVWEPTGSLVVDIGGGTTEVAVISLGGIVTSQSLRTAGDKMDEAIIHYIKKQYNLMIGERTAEKIKMEIGCAVNMTVQEEMDVRGRDIVTGLPRTITLTSAEVSSSINDTVLSIVEVIKNTLEKTPPELCSDIIDRGIVLSGGGALLKGLDKKISDETKMPVFVTENPLDSVAIGTGKSLDFIPYFRNQAKVSPGSTMYR